MTQWIERPEGGRKRGPRGIARAWLEVCFRPRRFFENGVAPGDQAPGLVFAIAVTAVFLGGRLLFAPETLPAFGSPVFTVAIVLGVGCFLVAPVVLHLSAALGTVALLPLVEERAGVSETVQIIGYASGPCVFVAIPVSVVQFAAAAYGFGLLVVGIAVVHRTTPVRAALAAIVPGVFVFGFAFGGIGAFEAATGIELLEDPRDA